MKITLISIYPDLWSFGLRTVSSILKREGNNVDLIELHETKGYSNKSENKVVTALSYFELGALAFLSLGGASVLLFEEGYCCIPRD